MLKVYYLKISDCTTLSEQNLLKRLENAEREVVKKLSNNRIRSQKCLASAMSRELIERLWQLRSEDYSIGRAEHGKPYVHGKSAIYYNISHSGDYIVCALSNREVGVDIQQMGKEKPLLAERFFHPNEVLKLNQTSPEDRRALFFRYWSAKESYLKYTGTGLSGSLSGFEILFNGTTARVKKEGMLEVPAMWALEIHPDYQCHLCTDSVETPELYPFHFREP
ncbi:MAG: 4'-phosphopantetheinyl transferase superfamily protein [Parabacteroides sp.]|nr:4'-phosphopantetheinyl transferase superfamily protein [Parabacteroides sp.]